MRADAEHCSKPTTRNRSWWRRRMLTIGIVLLTLLGIAAIAPFIVYRPSIPARRVDAFEAELNQAIRAADWGDPKVAPRFQALIDVAAAQQALLEKRVQQRVDVLARDVASSRQIPDATRAAVLELGAPVVASFEALRGLPVPRMVDPVELDLMHPVGMDSRKLPSEWLGLVAECLRRDHETTKAFRTQLLWVEIAPPGHPVTVLELVLDAALAKQAAAAISRLARDDALSADDLRRARLAVAAREPTVSAAITALQSEVAAGLRLSGDGTIMLPPYLPEFLYGKLFRARFRAEYARPFIEFFESPHGSWLEIQAASQRLTPGDPASAMSGAFQIMQVLGNTAEMVEAFRVSQLVLRAEEYRRIHGEYPPDQPTLDTAIPEIGRPTVNKLLYTRTESSFQIDAQVGSALSRRWPH